MYCRLSNICLVSVFTVSQPWANITERYHRCLSLEHLGDDNLRQKHIFTVRFVGRSEHGTIIWLKRLFFAYARLFDGSKAIGRRRLRPKCANTKSANFDFAYDFHLPGCSIAMASWKNLNRNITQYNWFEFVRRQEFCSLQYRHTYAAHTNKHQISNNCKMKETFYKYISRSVRFHQFSWVFRSERSKNVAKVDISGHHADNNLPSGWFAFKKIIF